jgi:hypothetical protein
VCSLQVACDRCEGSLRAPFFSRSLRLEKNVLGFTPVAMGMSEQLGQDFHPIYSNNNDKLF